ncbi:MAG: polysaccharide deacetylase family protein [Acidobacteriota bacterium]
MKRSALSLLKHIGLLRAARTLQRARAVILTYHGVLREVSGQDDFLNHNFVGADVFDQQLDYVRRHYHPIALSELIRCYRRGAAPPERSVAFTFDDGFANNHSVAFPILRRHGIPFTVFLTTGLIGQTGALLWTERVKRAVYLCPGTEVTVPVLGGEIACDLKSAATRASAARLVLGLLKREPPARRNEAIAAIESVCGRPAPGPDEVERYAFLTWADIREMATAGVEFGSHTVSHPILSTLDAGTLDMELSASKQRIESELAAPCKTFAYPNGSWVDFGEREKHAAERAGYGAACSLNGRLNRPRTDLYELDRINIGRGLDDVSFEAETAGLLGAVRRVRHRVFEPFRRPAVAMEGVRP